MAEPANRHTNEWGGKYYVHPQTGERFDSVTTVLDLVDKAALKQWAANLAADYAFENLGAIMNAQIEPDCGNTHNRCYLKHGRQEKCERCPCGECEACWRRRVAQRHAFESHRRAEEGHEVHEAINQWVLQGGIRISLTDLAEPYFKTFLSWVDDYGLQPRTEKGGSWEQTEVTLLNREHGYAGTSDAAVWLERGRGLHPEWGEAILDRLGVERALIRVDYKTREKPDERLYLDMPLQGAAYEACRIAMLPDGQEFEAPHTAARFILQLRPVPDKQGKLYTFKPMQSSGTFEAFLGVLQTYRWREQYFKTAFDIEAVLPFPKKIAVGQVSSRAESLGGQAIVEFEDPWADPEPLPPQPGVDYPDPAGLDYAAVQEAEAAADIVTPPKKAPAKKAPAKKAAKKATPPPTEPAPTGGQTMDSLRTFDPGRPVMSVLGEEFPF